jgi:hypothetical protein
MPLEADASAADSKGSSHFQVNSVARPRRSDCTGTGACVQRSHLLASTSSFVPEQRRSVTVIVNITTLWLYLRNRFRSKKLKKIQKN